MICNSMLNDEDLNTETAFFLSEPTEIKTSTHKKYTSINIKYNYITCTSCYNCKWHIVITVCYWANI